MQQIFCEWINILLIEKIKDLFIFYKFFISLKFFGGTNPIEMHYKQVLNSAVLHSADVPWNQLTALCKDFLYIYIWGGGSLGSIVGGVRGPELMLLLYVNVFGMHLRSCLYSQPLKLPAPWVLCIGWSITLVTWFYPG